MFDVNGPISDAARYKWLMMKLDEAKSDGIHDTIAVFLMLQDGKDFDEIFNVNHCLTNSQIEILMNGAREMGLIE